MTQLKIDFWLRAWNTEPTLVPSPQIKPKKYSARKYLWHNECLCWSIRPKRSLKRFYGKFRRIQKKTSVPESLFWCFLVNFAKFVRTPFLQNSTGRLLLIIAVSIVVKGVLANETVNYDTKALRKKCPNSKSSYYGVNLRIQFEYRKIRTRKNSVFRHFSCSETKAYVLIWARSAIY